MNKVLVGVVPSGEFERARESISELSNYSDYDDWLDSRYGRFMGLSTAGAKASLETAPRGLPELVRLSESTPERRRFG
jgi:hypothetical protein